MLLISSLGRPDVLPVDDFGIRTGFGIVYRKRRLPEAKLILKHGEKNCGLSSRVGAARVASAC